MAEPSDARRRRLQYQASRRGFKEADLAIGGFAHAFLDAMTEPELDEFERLLQWPDWLLYRWIVGEEPPPDDAAGPVLTRMMERLGES